MLIKREMETWLKRLFWEPAFIKFDYAKGIFRRFKRVINIVDSTTIQLVANCMNWAKHRKCKAAEKCHMRLDFTGDFCRSLP